MHWGSVWCFPPICIGIMFWWNSPCGQSFRADTSAWCIEPMHCLVHNVHNVASAADAELRRAGKKASKVRPRCTRCRHSSIRNRPPSPTSDTNRTRHCLMNNSHRDVWLRLCALPAWRRALVLGMHSPADGRRAPAAAMLQHSASRAGLQTQEAGHTGGGTQHTIPPQTHTHMAERHAPQKRL
jgi:hypothetical protein